MHGDDADASEPRTQEERVRDAKPVLYGRFSRSPEEQSHSSMLSTSVRIYLRAEVTRIFS
jgi:hypothetical protein